MLAEFRSGVGVDELDVYRCVRSSFELYGDNDFDVIERLAERGIAALSLEAWDNGYSIVTRYDMIRRVTGRPELFICPSA